MPTFLVQVSSGLVNRLLPAGLGGLSINALYLKRCGHTLPTSLTIVATNNAVGFAGNMLLLVFIAMFFPIDPANLKVPEVSSTVYGLAAIVVLGVALLVKRSHRLNHKLGRSIGEARTYFRIAAARPMRAFAALMSSMTLTALHAAAMFAVLLAVDVHVAWPVALFAISLGAFSGAAIPTPGGLGGAEAGIAAVLFAFSIPMGTAVAAALVYRGITYWLPLLPGYGALRIVEKRFLY
jgi:undecaprenyl-diphosphatase